MIRSIRKPGEKKYIYGHILIIIVQFYIIIYETFFPGNRLKIYEIFHGCSIIQLLNVINFQIIYTVCTSSKI